MLTILQAKSLSCHGEKMQRAGLDLRTKVAIFAGGESGASLKITGNLLRSPFRYQRHGQSGLELSEVLPHTARHAGRIAVERSMFTEHRNHEQALWIMHTGMIVACRPSIGAWVANGLGTENQNLPAYIVFPEARLPVYGVSNWPSRWMPPLYQGVLFRSEGMPVDARLLGRRDQAHVRRPDLQRPRSSSVWIKHLARSRRYSRPTGAWRDRRL